MEEGFSPGPVVTGQGANVFEGRFRVVIKKKFFMMRVVRHLKSLPRQAEDAPWLEMCEVQLDGTLSNLI